MFVAPGRLGLVRRRLLSTALAVVLLNLPSGFTIAVPYRPDIYRVGSGPTSTFITNYDLAARKSLITPVQTLYVDPASGSNNNDGLTVGAPLRSLDLAVRMANAYATSTRIVFAAAPVASPRVKYLRTATQARTGGVLVNGVDLDATYTDAWQTYVPLVDLIIEPSVAGGVADSLLDNGAVPSVSATADGNIYSFSATADLTLFDYTNLDDKGCPIRLAPLLTAPANPNAPWPEMNALWTLYSNQPKRGGGTYNMGVCWRNGTSNTMFVRTWDNRSISGDANIFIAPTGQTSPILRADTASVTNRRYVVEGLGFGGGGSGCLTLTGNNSLRPFVDLVRCRMFGNTAGRGALAVQPTQGTTTANGVTLIAVDCVTSYGTLDGFNVDFSSLVISIDCVGDWNGWNATGTNNGYTFHANSRGIDVMGSYRNNQDRNVHHVVNGMNWHLGTEWGTRRGADATDVSMAFALNGNGSTGTRTAWIDAPRIFDGPNGAAQYPYGVWPVTSVLNYANAAVTPVSAAPGWTGTIQSYVP